MMILYVALDSLLNQAVSPRQLATTFNEFGSLAAPVLLVIGVALALYGRRFVKILVFLAGGVIGASIGYALVGSFVKGIPPYLGAMIGFIALGLISYLLMRRAFGFITAGIAFYLTRLFVANTFVIIIVAIVGFIIGILMFNSYLSIVTAVGGGGMVWYALHALGLNNTPSMITGIVVMVIGIYYQSRQLQKK